MHYLCLPVGLVTEAEGFSDPPVLSSFAVLPYCTCAFHCSSTYCPRVLFQPGSALANACLAGVAVDSDCSVVDDAAADACASSYGHCGSSLSRKLCKQHLVINENLTEISNHLSSSRFTNNSRSNFWNIDKRSLEESQ